MGEYDSVIYSHCYSLRFLLVEVGKAALFLSNLEAVREGVCGTSLIPAAVTCISEFQNSVKYVKYQTHRFYNNFII